jgi:hypothetical protein
MLNNLWYMMLFKSIFRLTYNNYIKILFQYISKRDILLKNNHYYNAKQLVVHDAFQKYFSFKNTLNIFFIFYFLY